MTKRNLSPSQRVRDWWLRNVLRLRAAPDIRAFAENRLAIANPGFDGPFIEQDGVSELKMAQGWKARWEHGPNASQGYLVRPEFYPKNVGPVWNPSEDQCQGVQSTSATHRAAVVQRVGVPVGARSIRVEASVAYHGPQSGMAATIGIDPTGQTDNIMASSIIWSPNWIDQDAGWPMEEWWTVVHTVPSSITGAISIWLRSENRWRGRNNHVWWKQVEGTYESDEPGPGPSPDPGPIGEALARIEHGLYDLKQDTTAIGAKLDLLLARVAKAESTGWRAELIDKVEVPHG